MRDGQRLRLALERANRRVCCAADQSRADTRHPQRGSLADPFTQRGGMALARASWRRAEAEYRRDHLLADDAAQSNRPREVKAVGCGRGGEHALVPRGGLGDLRRGGRRQGVPSRRKATTIRPVVWHLQERHGRPPRAKGRLGARAPRGDGAAAVLRWRVERRRRGRFRVDKRPARQLVERVSAAEGGWGL